MLPPPRGWYPAGGNTGVPSKPPVPSIPISTLVPFIKELEPTVCATKLLKLNNEATKIVAVIIFFVSNLNNLFIFF